MMQQLIIETIATACLLTTYYAIVFFVEVNEGIGSAFPRSFLLILTL
jgi:hypothetical protein